MNKIKTILIELLPVLLMIALISLIENDYYLLFLFIAISVISFSLKYKKGEYLIFIFGLLGMTLFEYIFISTGVETFNRNSLFNLMPIWLPLLWAYSFIVIKRSVLILK